MAPRRKGRRFGNKLMKKVPPAKTRTLRDESSSRSGSSGSGTHTSDDESSSESSISDEDDPRDYKRGGYHPVMPYQNYHGRYRVLSKLGAGAFSTVWLCADEKLESSEAAPELVAMKVCKSKKSVTEQAQDEVSLLERLQEVRGTEARSPHVVQMRGHFWHTGPNGRHKCMVFEVMGENLLALVKYYDYKGLPMRMVRRLARHTLKGLEYIHSRGVIHTDVKLENVLVQRHDLAELLAEARRAHRAFTEQRSGSTALTKNQKKKMKKKEKNKAKAQGEAQADSDAEEAPAAEAAAAASGATAQGSSQKPPAAKASGVEAEDAGGDEEPPSLEACGPPVPPVRQRTRFATLEDDKVFAKLADFGNGCRINRKVTDDIQTRQYRSPEVIIGSEWDETADVWSASCMFFELITGDFLFDPRVNAGLSRDEDHLALMIELLGDFPPKEWSLSGKYSRDFFNTAGKLKHVKNLKFWSLPDVLEEKYHHTREDAEEISEFLLPMLAWEPRHRQSATSALQSPWLQPAEGEVDEEAVYDSAAVAPVPPPPPPPAPPGSAPQPPADEPKPPAVFRPPPRTVSDGGAAAAAADDAAVPARADAAAEDVAKGDIISAAEGARSEAAPAGEAAAAAPPKPAGKEEIVDAKNDETSTRDTSPGTGHSSLSTPDASPAEDAAAAADVGTAVPVPAPSAEATAPPPAAAPPSKSDAAKEAIAEDEEGEADNAGQAGGEVVTKAKKKKKKGKK